MNRLAVLGICLVLSPFAGCTYSTRDPNQFGTAGESISTPTGLGSAATLTGKLYDESGAALTTTATVYIPGSAPTAASVIIDDGMKTDASPPPVEADCGDKGGEVTCDRPDESFCAATCSCNDGTYTLPASGCPSTAAQVKYRKGEKTVSAPISCPPGATTCVVEISAAAPPPPAPSSSGGGSGVTSCDSGSSNAAVRLMEAICSRIVACHPAVSCKACREGILASNQLDDKFGVPVDESSLAWGAVVSKVDKGTFKADPSRLASCLADIGAQGCTVVGYGFSADSPADFENVENMIPEEHEGSVCEKVF